MAPWPPHAPVPQAAAWDRIAAAHTAKAAPLRAQGPLRPSRPPLNGWSRQVVSPSDPIRMHKQRS